MDFLEDLFDFGERKRRKQGDVFGQGGHHDDHEDHDGHHDDHHHRDADHFSQPYQPNPTMPTAGLFCTRCSTQLVPGAKFCHQCGVAIDLKTNCASCGSKLPANALFCPGCGYKNG